VGEGDFSGSELGASSDDGKSRSGMVDLSEGSLSDEGKLFIEFSNDRINLTDFQDFVEIEGREDAFHGFAHHGFAASWGADHQCVVKSCCCDGEGSFGENLSFDLLEIDFKGIRLLELVDVFVGGDGFYVFSLDEIVYEVLEMLDRMDDDVGDVFELEEVFFGDEEFFSSFSFGGEDTGEESVNSFYATVESEFAEKESVFDTFYVVDSVVLEE